jgi:predicted metal-dependent hydrolase
VDDARYWHGLELFNRGAFFDAHEVLEDVWREAPPPDRPFLQGVIQVAVALHHHGTGNREGARSVMARAAQNLAAYPAAYGGIDLAGLREAIARWQAAVDGSGTVPGIVIR